MASDPIPPSFPLQDVSAAISPFLKPRNEVQRVRALINAHVSTIAKSITSTSTSASSSSSTTSQSLSQSRAAKSLTGVRKSYIDAIREHEEALREWRAAVAKVQPPIQKEVKKLPPTTPTRTAFAFEDDDEDDQEEEDEEWLASRDAVLYLRKRLGRLQVAKRYLEKLQNISQGGEGEEVKAKSLQEIIYESTSNAPIPPPPSAAAANDASSAEDMLLPLEKAVLSMYEDLQKEKAMLRGAKELISRRNQGAGGGGGGGGVVSTAAKVRALRVVKATLEQWLDTQLKQAGEDAGTPRKPRPSMDAEGPQKEIDVEDLVANIQTAYDAYVESREALLVSIHKSQTEAAALPSPTKAHPPPQPSTAPSQAVKPSEDSRLALLPYIDRLVSTSRASKSTHALSAALAKTVVKDSESLSNMVDRLRGESRLLDEYHHPTETGGSNTSWIKQWKYAADESRKETVESVKADIKAAESKLDNAEAQLVKVKEAMGENEGGVLGDLDGKVGV